MTEGPSTSDFFRTEQRALQDRFQTRALADRIATITLQREVQEPDKLFIESCDMFFLSTVDDTGQPTCSYEGGEPGFRLRLRGQATLHTEAEALARWPGAELVVRIAVSELFVNCPRYVHRYRRVETSGYVPDAAGCAPFAQWKRIDAFQDVRPPKDQGRAVALGGPLTPEEIFANVQDGRG